MFRKNCIDKPHGQSRPKGSSMIAHTCEAIVYPLTYALQMSSVPEISCSFCLDSVKKSSRPFFGLRKCPVSESHGDANPYYKIKRVHVAFAGWATPLVIFLAR